MKKIPLTQGKFALVDDEDYPLLSRHKWCAHKEKNRFYAWMNLGNHKIKMHQLILGKKRGYEIDHIEGDGLDNQKINLRFVSRSLNNINTPKKYKNTYSQHKGVLFNNKYEHWQASIKIDKKVIYLGRYETEQDAAHAYDWYIYKNLGQDFNRGMNFPDFNYKNYISNRIIQKRSSKFNGVRKRITSKNNTFYDARITVDKKTIHIKSCEYEIDAAKAFDQYIIDYKLETHYLKLNFPEVNYRCLLN